MFYKAVKKIFFKQQGPVQSNDTFVQLVQSMKDDEVFSMSVQRITAMDPMSRKMILKRITKDMTANGAPEDHLAAMNLLKNDDICRRLKSAAKS